MVALIVLVAMTLAGIALIRSVDTTTLIAGNLGFQQSAMHSGDIGAESAIAWLQNNQNTTDASGLPTLQADHSHSGYISEGLGAGYNPGPSQTWDQYWTTVLDTSPVSTPVSSAVNSGSVWTLPTDPVTGNTISYVIHRLCQNAGDPTSPSTGCAVSQASVVSTGSSKGTGVIGLQYANQYYYRITTRITGPRSTVSYVQTIVAM
jgi:Tfp pilus assembly protein PilX